MTTGKPHLALTAELGEQAGSCAGGEGIRARVRKVGHRLGDPIGVDAITLGIQRTVRITGVITAQIPESNFLLQALPLWPSRRSNTLSSRWNITAVLPVCWQRLICWSTRRFKSSPHGRENMGAKPSAQKSLPLSLTVWPLNHVKQT